MTPSDENECRQMLYTGYHYNDGPSAVRYPRGNAVGVELTPLENYQWQRHCEASWRETGDP